MCKKWQMVNNDTYKQKLKKGLLINRINMIVDKHKSMVRNWYLVMWQLIQILQWLLINRWKRLLINIILQLVNEHQKFRGWWTCPNKLLINTPRKQQSQRVVRRNKANRHKLCRRNQCFGSGSASGSGGSGSFLEQVEAEAVLKQQMEAEAEAISFSNGNLEAEAEAMLIHVKSRRNASIEECVI